MSTQLIVTQWNANGITPQLFPSTLQLLPYTDILIVTETWLLPSPPSRSTYPIQWSQHHLYGPSASTHLGTQGVSILVNPECTATITVLPFQQGVDSHISFIVNDTLVHCLYLPPSFTDQQAIHTLRSLPLTTPTTNNTIFCGDFNARSMLFGDKRTTTRGTMLLEWMHNHDLTCLNQTLQYGIPTYEHYRELTHSSSIIDLFITTNPILTVDLQVLSSLSLHSPHRAVQLAIMVDSPATRDHPLPRRTWNLSRLMYTDVLDLYHEQLSDALTTFHIRLQYLINHPPDSPPDFELLAQQFNDALYQALDSSIGSKPPRPHDKNAWFWTDHLQRLVEQREALFRRIKHLSLPPANLLQAFHNTKQALSREIKRRKRESWKQFLAHLTDQDYPLTTSQIKAMRAKRKQTHTFSSSVGPQHAADTMATQLATTYNGSLLNPTLPPPPPRPTTHFSLNECPTPFTHSAVKAALTNLPRRKAPGPDHIKAEMLQAASAQLVPIIASFFTLCWQWSTTPSLWRSAQVVPIYKKGNPNDPSNYRPISLTSHMRKLMEHCLTNLISPNSPQLDLAQGGFRPNRSALDQVTCLQHLVHHHTTTREAPVVVFLDIKSAYDTVDRSIIWNAMQPYCSPPLLGLLQNLFDSVSISVLLSGYSSSPFTPTTGVLQGSVLSPVLYSIYINRLPRILRLADEALNQALHHLPPPVVPNTTLNSLLYADDIALIGTRDSMPVLLQVAEKLSLEMGFRWHPAKCVVLTPPNSPPRIYHLYQEPLPQHTSFRYLGVPFSHTGTIHHNELITHNRNAGLAALHSLVPLGFNYHGLPPKLSIALYKQFIRPTMEYGLAITTFTKAQLQRLNQIQHATLRKIFGGHPSSEYAVAQMLAGLPSLELRATILQAKFINRSSTLPSDALLTLFLPRLQAARTKFSALKRYNHLWHKLTGNPSIDRQAINVFQYQATLKTIKPFSLLSVVDPSIWISPLLTLPMLPYVRRLMIRWRRGWSTGKPTTCLCLMDSLTRHHTLTCSLLPPLPALDNAWGPPGHPLDRLLNNLPHPYYNARQRHNAADFWVPAWPQLIHYLATVEAIRQQRPLPTTPIVDHIFINFLQPAPTNTD